MLEKFVFEFFIDFCGKLPLFVCYYLLVTGTEPNFSVLEKLVFDFLTDLSAINFLLAALYNGKSDGIGDSALTYSLVETFDISLSTCFLVCLLASSALCFGCKYSLSLLTEIGWFASSCTI